MTAVLAARGLVKRFRIPAVRRDTVREHALALFRPRPFQDLTVLDGIGFSVERGTTVGLMGRNGSGKSTLLKILCGIYPPDAGEVVVGAQVTPILELGVGWNPDLDAVDNALLLGTVMGLSASEVRASMDAILAFAELERFANLELRHYSSGMAARLAYAVAFHAVREVLVLDEIFAVGDAAFQARCEARLRALQAEGTTILLVSHSPETVASFCHRGLLLEGGRLVMDDAADRVAEGYRRLLTGAPPPAPVVAAEARPPRVSVVMTCFDLGAYLDEAVDSVFAQTAPDFEIVIVDDGSTDPHTRRLLDGYARPRTRVISTENRGLPRARNRGIAEARGEYVCALDADDVLAPTFFEKALSLLDADPGLTFVSSWLEAFGEESWQWRQERCDLPALLAECTVHGAALVRRSALLEVGGYDETMPSPGNEDWDLWLGLVARGHRGVILPELLFRYRRRAGSVSTACTRGEAHLGAVRHMLRKHALAYERHFDEVRGVKEREALILERDNQAMEVDLAQRLRPAVRELAEEAARLRRQLRLETEPPPALFPAPAGPLPRAAEGSE